MARWGQKFLWAAVLIMAITALAACGTNNNTAKENVAKTQNAEESTSASTSAPTEGNGNAAEEGATRTIAGEFGDVEIPIKPQRVAGIYVEDYLKALGITPVVQWYHPSWGKQDYLNLDVPEFDITGSMEVLLEKDPDLIIVDGGADAAKYEQYSKIAPTYRLPEAVLQDSRQVLTAIADALGIPEKAESVLAAYDQKVAEGKAKLQQALGQEKVAVIRLNVADKTFALFGVKNRFTGVIYSQFGLTPVPMAAEMTEYQSIISEELIPQLEADHIIVFPDNGGWDTEGNQEATQILDGPLWKSLPAVKNGNVYRMERSHWQTGAITANSMKLDDLLKAMVK
ncbi:ABC transporter substrate-binding protein [Paenibacillus sp. FSL R5-0887]|jgi:iron complex transport system substrate-binding protein|uniref:ABC transporter substrate-binding protein n=1 Tax=Paenibacillus TaxID=44249 RepID=UPI00096FE02A|nr:ABC transporter substrate-binding protein [Paenibacillus odorifer]OMD95327.1 ferrichrome ABC transporter substrate-binding protein [Paenibacillus odorifer]OMD99337.1 ferrichrome ABC transporter substrate-binding protein [Paenibacillus odorifer]OME06801.1 ferrichrome ABC transporter substrate-binding protein [Paenibacillus odorifer]